MSNMPDILHMSTYFLYETHFTLMIICFQLVYLHFITSADKFVDKKRLIKPFHLMRLKVHTESMKNTFTLSEICKDENK